MTEQAKAARRAYKKEWQRKNPEKVKEYVARYWEKKAAAAELPADDLTDTKSVGLPAGAEQIAGQFYPATPLPESWLK